MLCFISFSKSIQKRHYRDIRFTQMIKNKIKILKPITLISSCEFSSSQIMIFLWGFSMLLDLRKEVAYPSQFYNMVFKNILCKGKIETMNTLPVTFLTFILSQHSKWMYDSHMHCESYYFYIFSYLFIDVWNLTIGYLIIFMKTPTWKLISYRCYVKNKMKIHEMWILFGISLHCWNWVFFFFL